MFDIQEYKKAELIVVSEISIPTYFDDYIKGSFSKYSGSSEWSTNLETGPVLCPFHYEKDPSFYYKKEDNYYNCFSCNVRDERRSGGNVVHLHKEIQGVLYNKKWTVANAVEDLAKMYGIDIPDFNKEVIISKLVEDMKDLFKNGKEMSNQERVVSEQISINSLTKMYSKATDNQKQLIVNVYALIKTGLKVTNKELQDLLNLVK